MKPPRFEYYAPSALVDALDLMATLGNARILAGGQSLMPMLNFRVASPDHLVDLNEVRDLAYLREEGDTIAIGAMTRQREIEFSPLVAKRLPLLAEAIRAVGHRQTRNRGTIGGSLCHLDPSAELPSVAMAMDATIRIASKRGTRELAMRDFPAGYMTPAIEADEILTEVRIRPWTGRVGTSFLEYSRRHGDFAMASVAVLIEIAVGRNVPSVSRASITLGGVGPAPIRVAAAETALVGRAIDDESINAAAAACAGVDAMSDAFVPGWYRQHLAKTLAGRALRAAAERVAS